MVCCFDGDNAGREAAWKALTVALPTLTAGHQLSFMFLPDGEDPDSLVRKEGKARFLERMGGAISAAEYLFQGLGQRTRPDRDRRAGAPRGSGAAVYPNHSGRCIAGTDDGAPRNDREDVAAKAESWRRVSLGRAAVAAPTPDRSVANVPAA